MGRVVSSIRRGDPVTRTFVVHHNPNNGRYRYPADPNDAVASATALVEEGESTWVAGNCRRMIQIGDLLLFKFGGARLKQEPGIYAAAHVTQAPAEGDNGVWRLRYEPHRALTNQLIRAPITGKQLARIVPRSFGSSIQAVDDHGRSALDAFLGHSTTGGGHSPSMPITHGLLILKEWLDKILAGTKTWEIRGKATARRGPIALIESKSGHVVGTCDLVDVVGPLTLAELQRNAKRAGSRAIKLSYETTYAWVLKDARRLPERVPYRHPSGAVIWVKLEREVVTRLERAITNDRTPDPGPLPCTVCSSLDVIPWVYGEPTHLAGEAAARGELMIGGCLIWPERPKWHCKACGKDFGAVGEMV